MAKENVLICGAGGFLGACATYYFEGKGHSVFAGVREIGKNWRLGESGAKQVALDITLPSSCEKAMAASRPEIVVNFAAYGAYPAREKDGALMRKANVDGVANLIAAAKKAGAARFVQIGSSSEYGPKNSPMKESDSPSPDTPYGATKLEGSKIALAQHGSGIETTVARPFSPFGMWEDGGRLVPTLVMAALDGVAPKLSSPHPKRDFLFVESLMGGIWLAAKKKEAAGLAFNFSRGKQMSVGEIAKMVGEIAPGGKPPEYGSVENPRKEPPMWQADVSRAEKILGWKPDMDVRAGLAQTLEWFRAHRELYVKK